jgi:hypothetical protein
VQYFSPYISADLRKMSVSFNTSLGSMENELMKLILDGSIQVRGGGGDSSISNCNFVSKYILKKFPAVYFYNTQHECFALGLLNGEVVVYFIFIGHFCEMALSLFLFCCIGEFD